LKEIPGYPDYFIETDGSFWSKRKFNGQILADVPLRKRKPNANAKGYLYVSVRKDGKYHSVSVARSVLSAYVGPCPPGCEARHLNGNNQDNRLDNLVWGTRLENCEDKRRHGTYTDGQNNGMSKFSEDDIQDIRRRVATGESCDSVATLYGTNRKYIGSIARLERWKSLPWPEDVPHFKAKKQKKHGDTNCIHGHPLENGNTFVNCHGHTGCLTCRRIWDKAKYQRIKSRMAQNKEK